MAEAGNCQQDCKDKGKNRTYQSSCLLFPVLGLWLRDFHLHKKRLYPEHLFIVYHSQTGHTQALAESVYRALEYQGSVETRLCKHSMPGVEDLLWADAVLFGTPENFCGYMSGALKDFFDRTYEAAKDATVGLPYTIFISAGNDGSGAEFNIDRIARGYSMRRVSEPLIVRGEMTRLHSGGGTPGKRWLRRWSLGFSESAIELLWIRVRII